MADNSLPLSLSSWMEKSTNPVYLASRIELRRNLSDILFPEKASPQDKERVIQESFWAVDDFFTEAGKKVNLYLLSELASQEANFLKKKGLITATDVQAGEALILDEPEEVAFEINRGDHLTTRITKGGFQAESVARYALLLDAYLGKKLRFAYSKKYGYLTSSLNEVGTGMRLILLGCFPALVNSDRVESLLKLGREGREGKVQIRKVELYGPANIFLLYNRSPLSLSEDEIIITVESVAQEAERLELNAREYLLKKEGLKLEDKIWKSYATLEYSRLLSFRDALYNISIVRMAYGLEIGMEKKIPVRISSQIFFGSDPDILGVITGQKSQEPDDLRAVRADWVRSLLQTSVKEKEVSLHVG